MFLRWLNIHVWSASQVLWYMGHYPPPPSPERPQKVKKTSSSTQIATSASRKLVPPQLKHLIEKDAPAFFAVVIGINNYKHIPGLCGAVGDANDMVRYLTDTLSVPLSHIKILLNEEATRCAIKKAFVDLASNDQIHSGDPIVIFFAGHGALAPAPPNWPAGGGNARIQLICPVDFERVRNEDEAAQGIPDITLAGLLSNLSKAKGDNITVIFDCCHSGSGTREHELKDIKDPDFLFRSVNVSNDYEVLSTIDREIIGTSPGNRISAMASAHEKTAMASHVLLAACSEFMNAAESFDPNLQQARGHFTRTLLSFLRGPSVQGATISYLELIERLPDLPHSQYPQCDGDNRNRILFNGKAPKRGRILYQVSVVKSMVTLQAGEAQGVSVRAIFSIFSASNTTKEVGRLVVHKVRACTSELRPIEGEEPFDHLSSAWALMVKAGPGPDIQVAIPAEDSFSHIFQRIIEEMKEQRLEKRNILAVNPDQPHELALSQEHGNAIFTLTDSECVKAGLVRIPHEVPLEDTDGLYSVLAAAADFFFYLRRSNSTSHRNRIPLSRYVELKAFELGEQDFGRYLPISENLVPEGLTKFQVLASEDRDDARLYGFSIINKSDLNLYIWAFMFDMSNLKIRAIYRPPASKSKNNNMNTHAGALVPADASIQPHGELTIGYGSGGGIPQVFLLNEEDHCDASYLKIFITTEYVDLSYIEQDSPFSALGRTTMDAKPKELWDAIHILVIQRRAQD